MSISRRQRRRIFARDGFTCYWCEDTVTLGVDATLEHVIPRSLGGTNRAANIVTACEDCNSRRADNPGPPPGIEKPLPDPQDLERRYRILEPPAFPDGRILDPRSSQYRAYRRWWNKRGFWQAAMEETG